jgi:hypothetical protein
MQTLSVARSYGCHIRGTSPGLYFRRARAGNIWRRELAAFIASIEDILG